MSVPRYEHRCAVLALRNQQNISEVRIPILLSQGHRRERAVR
jgi:hypothetical protein